MSSNRLSTYSPVDVTTVIYHPATGITHTIGGYTDNSIVNIERGKETYTHYNGVDDTSSRVYSADTSAKLTISLQQTSASNDVLYHIYNYDRIYRGSNAGVFHVTTKDGSGRSVLHTTEAYIGVVPNQQFGDSINSREWVIHCTRCEDVLGGNGPISTQDAAAIEKLGGVVPAEWRG